MTSVLVPLPTAGPSNPVAALNSYVQALNDALLSFVHACEERRLDQNDERPLSEQELDSAVEGILAKLPVYNGAQEVTKTVLEKALDSTVLSMPQLVSRSWQADAQHYLLYHDILDLLVTFVERQHVINTLAMESIESLLETQTVQSAELLFKYLETRSDKLMKDMQPGKGKALVILRTLNDLLRRLSKSTHTLFCGRILLYVASIFPLGERSGVNLRGEFNVENQTLFEWEELQIRNDNATSAEAHREESDPADTVMSPLNGDEDGNKTEVAKEDIREDGEELEDAKMHLDTANVDEKTDTPAQVADTKRRPKEPDFYTFFWSLQSYFANPKSLWDAKVPHGLPSSLTTFANSFPKVPVLAKDGTISSEPIAAATANFTLLREGIQKMLEVFADASRREKALQGAAKDDAGRSRKSETYKEHTTADVRRMFFYPKFLTSKSLIDLEVADSNFRKQVMIQCLILFQFLHSLTTAGKTKLQASLTTPNRTLNIPYILSDADNKWVKDLEARVYTEISRTPTDGESFVKTVRMILQSERNWVRWKSNSCPLFEKAALAPEISDASKTLKRKLEAPPLSFPHKAGTAALSRLWLNEPKSVANFAQHDQQQDLDNYYAAVKRISEQINDRKADLRDLGRSEDDFLLDSQLQQLEDRRASLAWRVLRILSKSKLHLFSKIAINDIEKLLEEMNKPRDGSTKPDSAKNLPTVTPGAAEQPPKSEGQAMVTLQSEEAASDSTKLVGMSAAEPTQVRHADEVPKADDLKPEVSADGSTSPAHSAKRPLQESDMDVDMLPDDSKKAKLDAVQ